MSTLGLREFHPFESAGEHFLYMVPSAGVFHVDKPSWEVLKALDEVAAVRPDYDPALPAHRAIGVPELMRYLDGTTPLDVARQDAIIATRQYAKRQRTWMRKNTADWLQYVPG